MSLRALALVLSVALSPIAALAQNKPPVASPRPYDVVSPNGTRNDPYYWLRDDTRTKPDILNYLKEENAYWTAMTSPYKKLKDSLAKEIIGRIKQDDSTVPYKWMDYLYYTRFEKGQEYPIHARKPLAGGKEQIIVDANIEAKGKDFYSVSTRAISPNQKMVAFVEDTAGRLQYKLRFREI